MDFLKQTLTNAHDFLSPRVNNDSHILSKAAYNPVQYQEQLKQRGFVEDASLSNEDARVYIKDGKAHVAYRGTSKLKDIGPDVDIALGKRKHRDFDSAVEVANKAKSKYGSVKTVGHSLGGTKALHAAKKLDLEAEVYNPGTSPIFQERVNSDKIVVHKNPFDIISSGIKGKSVRWWRNPFGRTVHAI